MTLYEEFFAIIKALNRHKIPYALIGGIAVGFHLEPRYTDDIDILVRLKDIGRITKVLDDIGYIQTAHPWKFRNTGLTLHRFMSIEGSDFVMLDMLACDHEDARNSAIISNALNARYRKNKVRIAGKKDLVWLKRQRNSDLDKIDIRNLSK
jgi:hypothetical protein